MELTFVSSGNEGNAPKFLFAAWLLKRERYWLRIWSWSLSAALWPPTAPQARVKCREHVSLYTVYVNNKVPLPLFVPVLVGSLQKNKRVEQNNHFINNISILFASDVTQ